MTGQYVALYLQAALEAEMGSTDGELLARFSASRDELAFATLVQRHGPMVFGVCQRTAGHYQDAEDAFQATFLVLAQKAGTIDRPALLGNWLYGVALRVSKKARSRRLLTRSESTMPEKPSENGEVADDLSAVIDHELTQIPSCYRDAILLCDVQGLSRSEAARRLGIPEGTISSRLAKGRTKLAARLTKRGVTLSALSTLLVVVPDALARKTVATALGWSAKLAIPQSILELTHIGGSAMKLTLPALVLLSIGALTGTVLAWPQTPKTDPTPAAQKPQIVAKEASEATDKPVEKLVLKPRIAKRLSFESDVGKMVWSSDGRFLAADYSTSFLVIDTKSYDLMRPRISPEQKDNTIILVGFIPGTHELVSRIWELAEINVLNQLTFWNVDNTKPRLPVPTTVSPIPFQQEKTVDLDLDYSDMYYAKLLNKDTFATLHAEYDRANNKPMTSAQRETIAYTLSINNLQNGSTIKSIPLGEMDLKTMAISPNGENLFILSTQGHEYRANCWSLKSGEKVWGDVNLKQISNQGSYYGLGYANSVFSPDGKKIAVVLYQDVANDDPDMRNPTKRIAELKLIDASTGKLSDVQIEALSTRDIMSIGGFSHDSKLIVFSTWYSHQTRDTTNSLQIWDVATGKLVKKWKGDATASFAPDRPMLAIVETKSFTDNDGKKQKKVSLGFWDLRKQAE